MINKKNIILFIIYAALCLTVGYSIYSFMDLPAFIGPAIVLILFIFPLGFYLIKNYFKISILKNTKEEKTDIDFANAKRILKKITNNQEACCKEKLDLAVKINQAIKNEKIEFVIQPIVLLPEENIRFYECFARLKLREATHNLIEAEAFISAAETEKTVCIIDSALIFHATRIIRDIQYKNYDTLIFCNLSIESILDKAFYTRFISFATKERAVLKNLIFEFKAAVLKNMDPDFLQRLDMLAKLGVCFSLDNTTDLETLDFKYLEAFCFRFVKVDASILEQSLTNDQSGRKIINFQDKALSYNVLPIVTRIETAAQLEMVNQFGFSLGQGYYFCAPQYTDQSAQEQSADKA